MDPGGQPPAVEVASASASTSALSSPSSPSKTPRGSWVSFQNALYSPSSPNLQPRRHDVRGKCKSTCALCVSVNKETPLHSGMSDPTTSNCCGGGPFSIRRLGLMRRSRGGSWHWGLCEGTWSRTGSPLAWSTGTHIPCGGTSHGAPLEIKNHLKLLGS